MDADIRTDHSQNQAAMHRECVAHAGMNDESPTACQPVGLLHCLP
ncbi:hypothetical protein [Burkholderia lata]|nr:hypothetical protein [Burkholderia lata]